MNLNLVRWCRCAYMLVFVVLGFVSIGEAAEPDSVLSRMRELHRQRRWNELVEQFEREDFSAWPAEAAMKTAEAFHLRGQVHSFLKNGEPAVADLKLAVKFAPKNEAYWLTLGDNYINNLNDDHQALAAYRQTLSLTGNGVGWQPLTATLAIVRIYTSQVKTDEALALLRAYDNSESMAASWRVRFLRAYGHVYAARGDEQESLAKFREALVLEQRQESLTASHAAKAGQTPLQVLMIGNSQCPTIVNNRMLEDLAASDRDARPIKVVGCIKGGASLRSHWEAGTGPETARGMILGGTWDFVVLQDIYNVQEAAFQPYARQFHQLIHERGAKTILFGTASILSDFPQGFERLHQLHLAMGKELRAPVVDASYAYLKYFGERPERTHMESLFAQDRAHPGLRGSYIYACGLYSAVTGRSPMGLAAPVGFSDELTKTLQSAAWAQFQETKIALEK